MPKKQPPTLRSISLSGAIIGPWLRLFKVIPQSITRALRRQLPSVNYFLLGIEGPKFKHPKLLLCLLNGLLNVAQHPYSIWSILVVTEQ